MNDKGYRLLAWGTAITALVMLIISAVMLFLAPDLSSGNWLENQVKSVVTLGAPILGLIIVTRQPRQRIGWLWVVYGLVVGLRTLGHAIYFYAGSQSTGYSDLEYFFLWATEPANFAGFVCLILLMLWFPDGNLLSRRWRFLYFWLFLAIAAVFRILFEAGTNWNSAEVGGIIIDNPYGWLPATSSFILAFVGFFSIVLIMILAAISLIIRYRSAGQLVRQQLRWFVFGGFLLIVLDFIPVFFIDESQLTGFQTFISALGHAAIIPLYLAVGIAILRYHLYDFDVIIRKTLVYALLSALLVLVYFGMVVLLQSVFDALSGQESPIAIVISTLVIAALFAPLRRWVQAVIDRRFFRKKYDAQQVLAQFAQTARDETDMERLTAELIHVVQETMQPEQVSMWLKEGQ